MNKLLKLLGMFVAVAVALALTVFGMTEEVEVCVVSGTVVVFDTGETAKDCEVFLETSPNGADLSKTIVLSSRSDSQGRFTFHNVPAGMTIIRAYAPGYATEVGVSVSKTMDAATLKLRWQGDELRLSAIQPVFSPEDKPTIVLSGLTRLKKVDLKIFQLKDDVIFSERNSYDLARNIAFNRYDPAKPVLEPKPFWSSSVAFTSRDIQGRFAERIELPPLQEGVYIIRAEIDALQQHQWINVSNLGLVAKVAPDKILGFVADIKTGLPVSGVDVVLVGPKSRQIIGRTSSDGTVRLDSHTHSNDNYVLAAFKGSSKAFVLMHWWGNADNNPHVVHLVTDRPIYRPGDTVNYKGFVRLKSASGYSLSTMKQVRVKVFDSDDTELNSDDLKVDAVGGFNGFFVTMPETTGSYRIEVDINGAVTESWVQIASYRKSEFNVSVAPEKKYYTVGDEVKFIVKATYFTGEPVVGAMIEGSVNVSDRYSWSPFDDEEYEWWGEEYDSSYGGELVKRYEVVTNEDGTATVSVPVEKRNSDEKDRWSFGRDQVYSIDVNGSDDSGRFFSTQGQVNVVSSSIELSTAFSDYVVAPGKDALLKIKGNDRDTGSPSVGAKIIIELGEYVWTGATSVRKTITTHSVTLDARGEAMVIVKPVQTGDFYTLAKVVDDQGKETVAQDGIWVYEHGQQLSRAASNLQVVLDKKQYRVGDIATALIRTTKPGGAALLTIEGDTVLWSKTVTLTQETTEVLLPVTLSCKPNVSVRAAYIRAKTFSEAGRSIIVDAPEDRLDVKVVTNRKEILPGGEVSFNLIAKDSSGKPVVTDIALSVVDEAIYAIKEDHNDPESTFFPHKWSMVSTFFSFPEIYLDGDDKSALNVQIRSDFKDTALWIPSVLTGKDGTATVNLQLPDNLTSWRATATAISANASYGKGVGNVVARKPIMVRLSPPPFMVQDDSQIVVATIMNATDIEERVNVSLQCKGVTIQGDQSQTVVIGARKSERVEWNITAPTIGTAKLTVIAIAQRSKESDGIEKSFAVRVNGPTQLTFSAGETKTDESMTFNLSKESRFAELSVSVESSLLGSLVDSIDDLVDYPYGCVEQTMSRYMPAVAVQGFLTKLGRKDPGLEAKIAEVAEQSQARLRNMQRSDGGFGWWENDTASPEMTALVLEGLYLSEHSGMTVNKHLRDSALDWGKKFVVGSKNARLAYALALFGVDPANWWDSIVLKPNTTTEELCYSILAIDSAKGTVPKDAIKIKKNSYRLLLRNINESDTMASWESDGWYEPTALALRCILRMEPNSITATKTLRFLMSKRRGNSWTSTRDTTQIIVAALEYLDARHETTSTFEVAITLNGLPLKTLTFKKDEHSNQGTFKIPLNEMRAGVNTVKIEVHGNGTAYFSGQLKQVLYQPRVVASDTGDGLKIKREYFRMESQRMGDGTIRLMPSKKPVESAEPGEVLHCRLTIGSDRDREYVLVEDPVFSHSRIIDDAYINPWDWEYWWSNATYLDDKAAFFIQRVQRGEHVLEYAFRAEMSGDSTALPATVSMMYQPDIRAASRASRLKVGR